MEQRILEMVSKKRNPTARDVSTFIRSLSTSEAQRILDSLVKAGVLETEPTHKGTLRYSIK
jgi:DNA-binding IclR family transcriptional regulator